MRHNPISVISALLLLCLTAHDAGAETKDPAAAETVSWTVAAEPAGVVKPASALTLTLNARVLDGWHVYGLKQLPSGPTPLRVSLESNAIASASGEPVGSPPVKVHDPSFDLDNPTLFPCFLGGPARAHRCASCYRPPADPGQRAVSDLQ